MNAESQELIHHSANRRSMASILRRQTDLFGIFLMDKSEARAHDLESIRGFQVIGTGTARAILPGGRRCRRANILLRLGLQSHLFSVTTYERQIGQESR